MVRRYLNLNETGEYLTSESDRFKQRVRNGLGRPIAAQPYNAERGTRIEESTDKPVNFAQAQIIYYVQQFIKKYYPEITPDKFKVESVEPLLIQWQFDLIKDV